MREIKFRGKSTDDEVWVFGCFCNHVFKEDRENKARPCISIVNTGSILNGYYEVDPSSVGQFTGLKDKDGKDIYEGDIIDENGVLFEICWYHDLASFIAEMVCNEKPFLMSDMELNKCKIVGNIFDNPPLSSI